MTKTTKTVEKAPENGQEEKAMVKTDPKKGLPGGPPDAAVGTLGIEIRDLTTMWWLANRVINSNLAPKDCKTVEDVFVRAQCGMAAGLNFMQSVQFVASVNGRPSIWGPPVKGLIMASGKCKSWSESIEGDDPFKDDYAFVVRTERTDMPGVHEVRFGTREANRAGLMGKDTYKHYPEDMIRYKCVARVATRHYGDVLAGLSVADESDAIDIIAEPSRPVTSLDDFTEKIEAKQAAKPEPEPEPEPEVDQETGEILDAEPEPDDEEPVASGVGDDALF